MRYMLDTNICIYILKKKPESVLKRLLELKPSDVCMSSVTYSELVYGVEKSASVEKNRMALAILLAKIEIVSFDVYAANCYGKIRADLEKKGTPIGPLDTMIAAHALSLGCTIVTNNVREFSRVDQLCVADWVE